MGELSAHDAFGVREAPNDLLVHRAEGVVPDIWNKENPRSLTRSRHIGQFGRIGLIVHRYPRKKPLRADEFSLRSPEDGC